MKSLNFSCKADIQEYENGLSAFRSGNMSEERFTPFRLQNGVYGQRQEGVHMIRVKLPGGTITPEQLEVIADCVEQYSGQMDKPKLAHITTRQDIQTNFVALDDTPAFLRKLHNAGMTTREACGNTVRNVTSCFLAGSCPAEYVDVRHYARAFARYFLHHPLTQYFPRKFKVSFSGCDTDCALGGMHDVGFIATRNDAGEFGFRVMAAGGLSSQPVSAIELEQFINPQDILQVGEALMRIHFRYSDRKRRARARMKYVLQTMGEEQFIAQYRKERAVIAQTKSATDSTTAQWRNPSGILAKNEIVEGHDGRLAILLNVFRGDFTAKQCRALAAATRLGDSEMLQLTIEQGIVITNIDPNKLDDVQAALKAANLHVKNARGIADVVACPGVESCRLAITSSRGLAAAIKPELDSLKDETPELVDLRVKISGCQHSCAQHHVADLGFHGLVKKINRQAIPHYQLHVGGSGRAGESFAFATMPVPAKTAPQAGITVLRAYSNALKDKKDLSVHDWAADIGREGLDALLKPFSAGEGEIEGMMYDWSENQPFSTKDNKPGECAAAVIGLTDALVAEAQYEHLLGRAHLDAMFWSEALTAFKASAIAAARAFLIEHGETPKDDVQVLPLLASLAMQDSDVINGLQAIQQGMFAIDLTNPAAGVTALRDHVKTLLDVAAQRFATIPVVSGQWAVGSGQQEKEAIMPSDLTLLDLSGVACPMNFVKTKIKLATMPIGAKLAVILDDGQPIENVPKSLDEQGQKIHDKKRLSETQWQIIVEKMH
ncbi:MAG: sulfurtransferase TusA family protein [Mariprofundales bacterium]